MLNITNTLITGIAITLITAAPVYAQQSEIKLYGPIPFAEFDRDANGQISENEFNAVRSERRAEREAADMPLGGLATAPSFADIDADHDGWISAQELTAAQSAHMMQHRQAMMKSGMGPGTGRNRPSFEEFDQNGDGRIVEDEFMQARAKRMSERAQQGYQLRNAGHAPAFSDIDANGDGGIDPNEFAMHQARMQQR